MHDAIVVFRSGYDSAENAEASLNEESREQRKQRFRALTTATQGSTKRLHRALHKHYRTEIETERMHRTLSDREVKFPNVNLPYARVKVTRSVVRELERSDDVTAIIPNQPVQLLKPTKVEYKSATYGERRRSGTWGLTRLRIPQLWDRAKTKGDGIRVAVLDTGVYADHPALSGKVNEFVLVDPLGRTIDAGRPFDAGSHGTHVCGTVVGGTDTDGVAIGGAPDAELIVAAVLAGDATLDTIISGIEWAVRQGADVISMSFGLTYYEPKFEEVLRPLWDLDILPVVAIGNENHGNTSSPGNVRSAFSVGATGPNGVAQFSGGASLDWPGTPQPRVIKPDVVAPGVRTYSSVPPITGHEYAVLEGTSMATPHVAAVAALLMSAKPSATAISVARTIRSTAYHPGGRKRRPDNRWGWGEVRALDAFENL